MRSYSVQVPYHGSVKPLDTPIFLAVAGRASGAGSLYSNCRVPSTRRCTTGGARTAFPPGRRIGREPNSLLFPVPTFREFASGSGVFYLKNNGLCGLGGRAVPRNLRNSLLNSLIPGNFGRRAWTLTARDRFRRTASTGKPPRFPGRQKTSQFRSVSEACRGLRTEFPPFSRVLRLNSPASLSPQIPFRCRRGMSAIPRTRKARPAETLRWPIDRLQQLSARHAEPADPAVFIEMRHEIADRCVDVGQAVKGSVTQPPEQPSLEMSTACSTLALSRGRRGRAGKMAAPECAAISA